MCEHVHHHHHGHSHEHTEHSFEEVVALLAYMIDHNAHHAEELHELAHDAGDDVAELLHKAVADYQMGTEKLANALALLKEKM